MAGAAHQNTSAWLQASGVQKKQMQHDSSGGGPVGKALWPRRSSKAVTPSAQTSAEGSERKVLLPIACAAISSGAA